MLTSLEHHTKRSFQLLSKRMGTLAGIEDMAQATLPISSQATAPVTAWLPCEILALMFLQFLALIFIWNFMGRIGTLLLFPFSFMSVLFHELGHAFMVYVFFHHRRSSQVENCFPSRLVLQPIMD